MPEIESKHNFILHYVTGLLLNHGKTFDRALQTESNYESPDI